MSAIKLLQELIRTPSFSGEEHDTAQILENYLQDAGIACKRYKNNIVAYNKYFDPSNKSILLNSHHDTVKINDGWTKDPFGAEIIDGVLYGRGSNDAGGPLVGLIEAFIYLYKRDLPYNLILAASAEEENFGPNGLSYLLQDILPEIHFGIIGEPTTLSIGVAQKGLIVIDGKITGKSGHAARDNGINAIYQCLEDIQTIQQYKFKKISPYLGSTTVQLTVINAGMQHNVIPDLCSYVLDVRVNDCYTLEEVMDELNNNLKATLVPRSLRWHSRGLDKKHPIFKVANDLKIETFGSPTLSDQVHCTFPTIKIGPGVSARSHTSDEYIKLEEVEEGIATYIRILEAMAKENIFLK